MKTLFFLQGNPGSGGGLSACDTPNPPFWCDNFDPEPVATIDDWSYWIVGIIFITCAIYMAFVVFMAYKKVYHEPRVQTKWIRERFPEEKKES